MAAHADNDSASVIAAVAARRGVGWRMPPLNQTCRIPHARSCRRMMQRVAPPSLLERWADPGSPARPESRRTRAETGSSPLRSASCVLVDLTPLCPQRRRRLRLWRSWTRRRQRRRRRRRRRRPQRPLPVAASARVGPPLICALLTARLSRLCRTRALSACSMQRRARWRGPTTPSRRCWMVSRALRSACGSSTRRGHRSTCRPSSSTATTPAGSWPVTSPNGLARGSRSG